MNLDCIQDAQQLKKRKLKMGQSQYLGTDGVENYACPRGLEQAPTLWIGYLRVWTVRVNSVSYTHLIEDKILLLVREEILNDLISGDVVGGNDPDQQSYPVDVDVEMQLPGLDVDVAGQDIVQNYIFNEVIAVIFLIVVLLDAGEGDGQNRRIAGGHIIGALDKDSIVRLDVRCV